MKRITFGIVGAAWRSEFYLRIAAALPGRFGVAGITSRDANRRAELTRQWGVAAFESAEELAEQARPDFVVTSIPPEENPGVIERMAALGMPVLSETPPAKTVEALVALHALAGGNAGGKVQVAEQFHLQPHYAARIAIARSGILGRVSQVQIAATHTYHQMSLIRRLLGVKFEACTVSGWGFDSPVTQGPGRGGVPTKDEIVDARQEILHFDYGDRHALYDYAANQHRSWIRHQRVLVRGERGELMNNHVKYLKDYLTPIELELVRHAGGAEGNLEGHHLKGIQFGGEWIYTNPYAGAAFSDEEIAIAGCLDGMARYVRTGEPFYSLAEACQDQYLSLMGEQAIKSGAAVRTAVMPWAEV